MALAAWAVVLAGAGALFAPIWGNPPAQAAVPSDANSTTPCVASPAPAQWKHVVVLMFENRTYSQVMGSADAPYITSLAQKCATTASWYDSDYKSPGVKDGSYISKPNYATLTSGVSPSVHGLLDDTYGTTTTVDNIFRQLRHAGKAGKVYYDAASPGCTTRFNGDYHDPLRYYVGDNGADAAYCASNDVPLPNFMTDVNNNTLPDFSMIIPTNCENMHSCSTVTNTTANADNWAKGFLPQFFDSARYKSGDTAFFFVWDEDTNIPNLLAAPSIKAGGTAPATSHFGATRTWDEMLGLPYLGVTNTAPHTTEDLLSVFNAGGTAPADTTAPTTSITAPTNGATVTGTVTITASAADNVGVSKVEFYVDNALKSTDNTSSYSYSLDTTSLSNGSHTLQTKAYDAAGNVGTSTQINIAVSNGCAAISAPYGQSSMVINVPSDGTYKIWSRIMAPDTTNNSYIFQTDGACNVNIGDSAIAAGAWTWVNYRDGSANNLATVPLKAGTHTLLMVGREPGVKLDRVLLLSDTCVPTGTGDNCTGTPDTAAPTASITSPIAGASVKSPVTVTASASDTGGSGVAKVDFLVDGFQQASISAPGPYTWTWSTSLTGSHTIGVRPTDVAGNIGAVTTVTVTLQDGTAPSASITSPTSGATVSGTVPVAVTASDNVGVSSVDLLVDGLVAQTLTSTTSSYGFTWNAAAVANGSHTLQARAKDAAGNTGLSTVVNVTVANDTTAPSAPTNLSASAASATQVNLSWSASTDNVGVSKYQIKRGGTVIKEVTGSTLSYSDTSVVASTSYSYNVVAVDGAGNTSSNSNTATVTTPSAPDTTVPSAPTNLAATATTPTQVSLTWTASTDTGGSGLKGYKVYRNGTLIATTNTTATSYGDATVSASTSYTYAVSAIDGAGNESAKSATASVTTPSSSSNSGDANNDGKVNVFDLSILLSNWNTTASTVDFNKDGTVNVFDLSILLSHWTG